MLKDTYGRRLVTDDDLVSALYINPDLDFSNTAIDDVAKHNAAVNANYSDLCKLQQLVALDLTPAAWHQANQSNWHMPDEYKSFDIAAWVLAECNGNEVELQRCGQELLEYSHRNLLPLLCYLKYLVDTMRKAGIVWGVGRGSSVASFVLYKIGVHRINSITYQLPLEEFFKELHS